MISSFAIGQHGFIPEFQFGSFDKINLTSAAKTNIGTTQAKIGASDFGPGGILYAIDEWYDGLYQIDTADGSATLLGTITPPADHIWTGMAYDEQTGIMYGMTYHDVYQSFYSSLYTIDVTNVSYTFIGSQDVAPAIGCIGIDGIGDLYAMQLGNPAKLYKLDKATGGVISYQGPIGHWAGGPAHGMDYDLENQTMYLTTETYLSTENTLRTINLANGSTTIIGDLGIANWIGTIAIAPVLSANFSADTTDICNGETVNFTDESIWATSWSWTFEGGTPIYSTDQNPIITYNTAGIYDVTLVVSNGQTTETHYVEDMITVRDIPIQPDTPSGPTEVCGGEEYTYTTLNVPWALTYLWEVLPADAGVITGTDISAIFESADDWTGTYTIKVMADNACGSSPWSSELSCILNFTAYPFPFEGGGSYCEGGQGLELTLGGSEIDVDYELFFDNISTGTILPGTGNPLSFGYQTEEGTYSVTGHSTDCSKEMSGQPYVNIEYIPGVASQPTGPDEVCTNTITDYSTATIPDADTLIWILSPPEAGIIVGSGENISIEWSENYNGLSFLSVYGSNDCGDGSLSDELQINVLLSPEPEVTGDTLVCQNDESIYTSLDNPGSTYNWEVDGGNIINGSGTSEITILWTTVGVNFVLLTEISSNTCEGTSDTLQVTVDDCTGIREFINGRINIYPNPAKDLITISFTFAKRMTYEIIIYNQYGQKIHGAQNTHTGGKGTYQFRLTSLPTGLYYVKMTTSSNQLLQSKFELVK